ncbi:ABC transporter permease [Cytobacillus oceanisediminis]|uniref:ABC transporter n=2 Tax=Cytobacillus oceanisediminis TaxID=665099 RepID=A0A160M6C7_9BACI|nr:ABC transporter permease [Cytobacillus oceanisediminis]AND37967.1 ABC transporter [Cytobacillus oceanisediminis 2691]OHX49731.1 ABC transporter [Cytobacillus oceanisediminis]
MTFSMKRSMAILYKDYKDVSKNLYVSTTVFLPLVMAAIYGRMGIEAIDAHYMVINMIFSLVAAYVQCSLIAEEKEKNTLRGLMLSPASTLEILFGKSLLSFISTIAVIIIAAFLTGYNPDNVIIVGMAIILSAIFYIGIGTLLGLLTKSVMEASVVILPIMMIFSFGSFLTPFIEKYPVLIFIEYLPNLQLIDLANQIEAGAGLSDVWSHLAAIIIWTAAVFALVVAVYKKRMMD